MKDTTITLHTGFQIGQVDPREKGRLSRSGAGCNCMRTAMQYGS
jgi:hypothetical protein